MLSLSVAPVEASITDPSSQLRRCWREAVAGAMVEEDRLFPDV